MNIANATAKPFSSRARRHLTLVELLIVLAIVAMASGIAAIQVGKAVREQRFRSEVAIVASQLRLAQDLMLLRGSYASVNFKENDAGQIDSWVAVDTPLGTQWEQQLQQRQQLRAIHWVELKEGTPKGEQGTLTIDFYANGTIMSRGLLRLSTAASDGIYDALTRYICLPGVPAPLAPPFSSKERALVCLESYQKENSHALTRDAIEEVQRWR